MRANGRSRFATRLFTRGTSMLLPRLTYLFWTTTTWLLASGAERLDNGAGKQAMQKCAQLVDCLANPVIHTILCRTELEGLYAPFSSCIMIGQDIGCMPERSWQAAAIAYIHQSDQCLVFTYKRQHSRCRCRCRQSIRSEREDASLNSQLSACMHGSTQTLLPPTIQFTLQQKSSITTQKSIANFSTTSPLSPASDLRTPLSIR